MKNWIILLAMLFLRTTFCSSQGYNFYDLLMPSLDTGSANPSNYIYFPPVNQVISTLGNGSVYINGSLNITGAAIVTDQPDVHLRPDAKPQTEPSLTINKNHPNNIIISSNYAEQITSGGFVSDQSIFVNSYFNLDPVLHPWLHFRYYPPGNINPSGDLSTAVDAQGNLYCSTIDPKAKNFFMDLSYDLGNTWPMQLDGGLGATTSLGNFDKLMIAVDNLPYSPNVNKCYASWLDRDYIPSTQSYEFVKFSNRQTGGLFSTPVTLSQPGNRFGQGTNIKTGPYGEVYVCWADYGLLTTAVILPARNIGFAKDLNQGGALMSTSYPAQLGYLGIRKSSGASNFFNNTKVNDFPVMAVDRTCGPTSSFRRGRIYITYPENIPNTLSHSRIVVQYSDDQGTSWTKGNSNPEGTIDVNGNQNWMPWIAVDDASGNVYVAYLSAPDPPILDPNDPWMGTFPTDVWLAVSEDGGTTFTNIKVSDYPVNPRALSPTNQPFTEGYWGDYIALDAYGGNVYVAWMSNYQLQRTYNIFCSTVNVTTPVEFSSQQDLPLNGPIWWSAPPNSPTTVLYEAVNTITAAVNQGYSTKVVKL